MYTRTNPDPTKKTCLRNPPLITVINIRKKHGKAGRDRQDKALVHVETGLSRLHGGKERWGKEDGGGQTARRGGMHDLRVEGTEHRQTTHTTHRTRGGVVRLRGWLTVEADWFNFVVSKTAVPSSLALDCRVPGISM